MINPLKRLALLIGALLLLPAIAGAVRADGGPPDPGKGGHGKITAISATSITVTNREGVSKTFTINSDTRVKLDGQDSAVSSITTSYFAGIRSEDGSTAACVDAHSKPPPHRQNGQGPQDGHGPPPDGQGPPPDGGQGPPPDGGQGGGS